MVFKTMFLHLLLKLSLVPGSSTGEQSSAFICVWGINVPTWTSQTSPSSCIRVLASIARAKLPTNPWLCRLCEGRPLCLAQILLLSQPAWVHWIPTGMICSTRSPQKCPIVYLVWLLKRGKFHWLSYSGAFWLNTSWKTAEICTSPISFPPLQIFWVVCFWGGTFWPDGSPFIWETTPPQHLARLECSAAMKSAMVTQFLVLVLCNYQPNSHAAASRYGFEASPWSPRPSFVSEKLHRNDSLQPVLTQAHHARSCAHISTAKLPCDSHRGLFLAAHTIYLSNNKYSKNNDKHNVSEEDTTRHPRLRASVLISDPEKVIMLHHEKGVVSMLEENKRVFLGHSFTGPWFQTAYVSNHSLSPDLSFPPSPLPCTHVSLWGCAANWITEMIWA